MTWSQEALDLLKSLVDEGQSAGQIAARMGISRSAVVGKIHRAGGALGKLARPAGFQRKTASKSAVPGTSITKAAKPAIVPARAIVAAPPMAMSRPAPLPPRRAADIIVVPMPFSRAISQGRCLFYACDAYAPPSAEMLVCGCKRALVRGKPYCTDHLAAETERVAA
ncbi:GcrA family cell cycle regulator [Aminobacter niigataensis]|uniref:GcrA family cell cycle regulator n=1 Tax=Aminobacter niigataensis TaxID=83265 RepID=UPI0024C9DF99|nr:GcrA family cell cycle regulator [Aminobacter niigataensis]CAI2936130.1 conserved protein of unknown function [Aminobacter niigataensis]